MCDKLARDFVMDKVLPAPQNGHAAVDHHSSGSERALGDDSRRGGDGPGELAEFRVFGAFSGDVTASPHGVSRDGCVWTEASLNRRDADLDSAELLVVCNKLETGFDEPRLALMYIDRHLTGARCVQVLSRANR